MKTLVIAISSLVFLSTAAAEELSVKLICKNGKCVPASSNNVDPEQARKLRTQLEAARRNLERASTTSAVRERALQNLENLQKRVRELQDQVDALVQDNGNVKSQVATQGDAAKKSADALGKKLASLQKDARALRAEQDVLVGKVSSLPAATFELTPYGFISLPFGPGAGAMGSVVLPMGQDGLWALRLGTGLGVSPSTGIGWITQSSLTRRFDIDTRGSFSIGPAVLALGDLGQNLESINDWLVGGGVDLIFAIGKYFRLAATPFVGTTPVTNVGVSQPHVHSVCLVPGQVFDKTIVADHHLEISGGVMVRIGAALF